ncbi:MAG: hypothetical protein JSV61_04350 [Anaerolineales bacterium]|nr:MAG: hypothetical protein JSV61_04350 [Anaerolineales bacterium]
MNTRSKNNLALGLILVLLGGWFLVLRLVPGLEVWADFWFDWPIFVVGAGVLLLFIGLLTGATGMAVPATIVGGIGGLLYWQNATGNWESWAYAWALIPGFVGLGVIFAGLLGKTPRQGLREGGNLIVISLVLFAIFSSFLGGNNLLGAYWPVLLILLGLWMVVRPLFKRA